MILVVVGTQLAFDRLIQAVDEWAGAGSRRDVFAQIGPSQFRPRHMEFVEFLEPREYDRRFADASVLIAHAGMGSILGALESGKPVVIMPRRASLGEHRNEHQLATADRFRNRSGVVVAEDEQVLASVLNRIDTLTSGEAIGPHASPRLIHRIRSYILQP